MVAVLYPEDPEFKDQEFYLVSRLGVGGYGEAFKAYDTHNKYYVCVKILNDDRQLEQEAAIAKLGHPNIL